MLNRAALTPRLAELEHQSERHGRAGRDHRLRRRPLQVDQRRARPRRRRHRAQGDRPAAEYRAGDVRVDLPARRRGVHRAARRHERAARRRGRREAAQGRQRDPDRGPHGDRSRSASPPRRQAASCSRRRSPRPTPRCTRPSVDGRDRVRLITGPGQIVRKGVLAPASRSTDFKLPDGTLTREIPATAAVAQAAEGWDGHMAFERKTNGNWLVRDDVERDHLLDLAYRARGDALDHLPARLRRTVLRDPVVRPVLRSCRRSDRLRDLAPDRRARAASSSTPTSPWVLAWLVTQTGSVLGYSLIQGGDSRSRSS